METKNILEIPTRKAFDRPQVGCRCWTHLQYIDVYTLGDLTTKTEKEIREIRNIGNAAIAEIKRVLGEYGLTLKNEENNRIKHELKISVIRVSGGFILTPDEVCSTNTVIVNDDTAVAAAIGVALKPAFENMPIGTDIKFTININ